MKSYGVTIQMKALQQYFGVVPFKKMKSGILSNLATSGGEKKNCWKMCHENEASRELHEMDGWITALPNENHDR